MWDWILEHKHKFVIAMQYGASTQITVFVGTFHTAQLPAHF